jgi:hypothetical protein
VKNGVMSSADASKLTFKAISLFTESSGLHDYLLALLAADREIFQCQYDAKLRQFMTARNLLGLVPDASQTCAGAEAPAASPAAAQVTDPTAAQTKAQATGTDPAADTATGTDSSTATGTAMATEATPDVPTSTAKASGRASAGACGVAGGEAPAASPAGIAALLLMGVAPLILGSRRRRRHPSASSS